MFFHAEHAKTAKIYSLSYFTLALEGRKLRYDKSAQSSIHPFPPSGYSPCLRGRVSYNRRPALTNCPSETGGRARSAEGVDSSRFCFSLRSLSRVASDYSSDSVVCFGNSASFALFA